MVDIPPPSSDELAAADSAVPDSSKVWEWLVKVLSGCGEIESADQAASEITVRSGSQVLTVLVSPYDLRQEIVAHRAVEISRGADPKQALVEMPPWFVNEVSDQFGMIGRPFHILDSERGFIGVAGNPRNA